MLAADAEGAGFALDVVRGPLGAVGNVAGALGWVVLAEQGDLVCGPAALGAGWQAKLFALFVDVGGVNLELLAELGGAEVLVVVEGLEVLRGP